MEVLIESVSFGKPVLKGRKFDVRHVLWGITVFDPNSVFTYQNQFGVSLKQVKHALLYCKDERCVKEKVAVPCTGCGKFGEVEVMEGETLPDCSRIAKEAFGRLQYKLGLPDSYEELIRE